MTRENIFASSCQKKTPKKVLPFWWWNHGKHQQRNICKQPRIKAKAWRQMTGSNKHNTRVCRCTLPLNRINEASFTGRHTSSLAFMFHVIVTTTDGSDLIQHFLHLRQKKNSKGKSSVDVLGCTYVLMETGDYKYRQVWWSEGSALWGSCDARALCWWGSEAWCREWICQQLQSYSFPLALCETVQITLQIRPDNTAKNESHFLWYFRRERPITLFILCTYSWDYRCTDSLQDSLQ